MKNSSLPKLRIDTSLFEKIKKCLEKINSQSGLEISFATFQRMALKNFVEKILSEGLIISIIPKDTQ